MTDLKEKNSLTANEYQKLAMKPTEIKGANNVKYRKI